MNAIDAADRPDFPVLTLPRSGSRSCDSRRSTMPPTPGHRVSARVEHPDVRPIDHECLVCNRPIAHDRLEVEPDENFCRDHRTVPRNVVHASDDPFRLRWSRSGSGSHDGTVHNGP